LHIGARGIAFHVLNGVGIPEKSLSRLNTRPAHSPVNASPPTSRSTMHDSGLGGSLGLSQTRLSLATSLPVCADVRAPAHRDQQDRRIVIT
jgi:hypothetical protein